MALAARCSARCGVQTGDANFLREFVQVDVVSNDDMTLEAIGGRRTYEQ
jgi:hypothetical protein